MKKRSQTKKKAILIALLPALVVASLVYAADTYYDLDATKVVMNQVYRILKNLEILGNLEVGGHSTTTDVYPSASTYTLGSSSYKWANIYAATTTIGNTIIIDSDDIRASSGLTVSSTDIMFSVSSGDLSATSSGDIYLATNNTERLRILSTGEVGIASSTPSGKLSVNGDFYLTGNVKQGTWQATDVGLAHGGTGASDAATARTNLGLTIGTDVQAWDYGLDALAGLATTNDYIIISDGSTWTSAATSTLHLNLSGMLGTLDDISDGSTYVKLTATKEAYIDQDVTSGSSPTFGNLTVTDLDTGQGAYELYAMDQDVQTTDTPTFGELTVSYGFTAASSTLGNATATEFYTSEGINIASGKTYKINDTALACSNITNCVANAYDALTDITLANKSIFWGNASNNPEATSTITILSSGSVGIGTSTPFKSTSVSGDFYATTLYGDGSNLTGITGGGASNWSFVSANAISPTTTAIGIIISASSTFAGNVSMGTSSSPLLFVDSGNSNVGIATTSPRYKLDVWGNLALGTTTDYNTPLLYVDSGNGYVGIATTTPYAALTINESDDFAFGSFNEKVIDNMEGTTLEWLASSTDASTQVTTSTESTIVKVGSQALKIMASSTCEDDYVRKSYSSGQDWSAYERLSFWIQADRFATSTATTTQLLSFQIYDPQNPSKIDHEISFQEEDRWQYEEVVLNATGTTARDGVTHIQFLIDFGNIATTTFYIDQIRLYNSTERSAEMFVDKDGALVITGRDGVELVAPQAGAGTLPGVKVDAAVVELGQPLSVNTGGDMGLDYDLQFLNTGLSQITSEGPLRISAGDSNHMENLTLTTGNKGDIIVELANASSSFMITQAAYATTTAFIINSEQNATTTSGSKGKLFEIISDYGSDENVVFSVDAGGSVRYDMSCISGASDVAENYLVGDETIEPGDVVCLNGLPLTVEKCCQEYQADLIGVISSRPALLMAGDMVGSTRMVTLVGRVAVKVSTENGLIAIGDPLTSASSTPGIAMKATNSGKILGYALEEHNTTSTGSILAFINLDERGGGDLTVYQNKFGDLVIADDTLVVKELKTQHLEVQTGITIYDRATGEPYCIYVENGAMETATGTCTGIVSSSPFEELFFRDKGSAEQWSISENGSLSTSTGSTSDLTPGVNGETLGVDTCQNGANRPCGTEIGVCQIGVEICEQGVWGDCIGAVFPSPEICDEIDNDCDGQTDEDDVCASFNATTTDTVTSTSTEPVCEPTQEICDGLDNNCDGEIDEDVDCGITPCDISKNLIGECQNSCFEGNCQNCTPTCSCAEGFLDCDDDLSNGCEMATSTCPIIE